MPIIAIWLIALAIALLCGCNDGVAVRPLPHSGPGSALGSAFYHLGVTFLWVGSVSVVVGLVIRLFLGAFPTIAMFIAEAGACAAVFGALAIWLGDHTWVFIASCIAAGLAWAYLRRNSIRRWLGIGPTPADPDTSI